MEIKAPQVFFYFACYGCTYLCFGFSGDDVFMPNKAECDEYVLEEFGIIFAGNKNHINSFGWNFGQVNAALKHQCFVLWFSHELDDQGLFAFSSSSHTPLKSRSLVLKSELVPSPVILINMRICN